jgi:arylsulfatase
MIEMEESELYHIPSDPSESRNVIDQNPGIVSKMNALAEKARVDMGDALQDREGKNNREPGRVN